MFLKILLLSLLYGQVIGYECGIVYNQEKAQKNIINKGILKGDWPWVVAIFDNGKKICTGFIISPKFVLTAAHCYNKRMLNKNIKRHSFSIHAGTIYANEGKVVSVKTNKIRTFDETIVKVARNDIAILEVSSSLKIGTTLNLACTSPQIQS
jgi:secreted trypsin-like serine protease